MAEDRAKLIEEEERITLQVEARVEEILKKEEDAKRRSAKKYRNASTQTDIQEEEELDRVFIFLKELAISKAEN